MQSVNIESMRERSYTYYIITIRTSGAGFKIDWCFVGSRGWFGGWV